MSEDDILSNETLNEEIDCFGDYPIDTCTQATCQEYCQDAHACKERSEEP